MQELEVLYFVMILKIYNDLQDFEESRRSSEIEKFTKVLNCKILQKYASKFCKKIMQGFPRSNKTHEKKLSNPEKNITSARQLQQCIERVLNKIGNPFNKTFTWWENMLKGFQIYFA